MTEEDRRTARLSVGRSEARGGEEVVQVFGMPSRIDSSRGGPATRTPWDRLVATAREHGSTALDLNEWDTAVRADREL